MTIVLDGIGIIVAVAIGTAIGDYIGVRISSFHRRSEAKRDRKFFNN